MVPLHTVSPTTDHWPTPHTVHVAAAWLVEPVGPIKPCEHGTPAHSVCPGDVVYLPGGHRVHDAFAAGIWPAGHDRVHPLAPAGAVELPAHGVHDVPPADELPIGPKLLTPHIVPAQEVAPFDAEYWPEGQGVQEVAAAEAVPVEE
jgi:hypothetical protein